MPLLRPAGKESIQGFVLAGGRSRRFGSDKAFAVFQGRTLLACALDALAALGVPAAIVAPDARRYAGICGSFVESERPGLGPVEGARASLDACARDWALILSVDMPGVDAALLGVLVEAAREDRASRCFCFADSSGMRHPFPGLYNRAILDLWAPGRVPISSMQDLLDAASARSIGQRHAPPELDLDRALHNVNRPRDLDDGVAGK